MALACSATPVALQVQETLCQSACRAAAEGPSHVNCGVSWASSFGSARLFHAGPIRSGGLFTPFYAFCNINPAYSFARFYSIRITPPLRNLFLIIFLPIFLRYYSGAAAKGKLSWLTYSCSHRNSRGARNHRPCGMSSCETRGRSINF